MERAVITGMGVVTPIGNTIAEFSENLFAGQHGIVPIEHFDTSHMNVSVYAPVKGLDAAQHFPARELRRMDPYTQFGMIAAREAVAQSGMGGNIDPFRLSVLMTTGLGGVSTVLAEHETLLSSGPGRVSPMTVPKWISNILAGMVSIEMGAKGAAVAHVAACASSAISIGEGVRAIRHGYADAVICGGAEALTQQLPMAGFQNLRALTKATDPDRASLPFDRERGGFVMGEGAGALVLESETHARGRGATILAEVTGYGITSDAHHITAPAEDGGAIDRALRDALAEAGQAAGPMHVNAHGTGTSKNDAVEAATIARVLGDGMLVTSTKSMTGHLLGAAGAAEAVAAVLSLERGLVPPTVGTTRLDEGVTVDVVTHRSKPVACTRALSLSLGFGGHNVCLVIDRPAS